MLNSYTQQKRKRIKITIISTIGAFLVGGIIFFKFKTYQQLDHILNNEIQNGLENIDTNNITQTLLPKYKENKNMNRYLNSVKGYGLIQQEDFAQALETMEGENSEDYYNRGTTKLLRAYNQAYENTFTGIQTAQILLHQSLEDLEVAKKIALQSNLDTQIDNNRQIAESIGIITNIKYCYIENQMIITKLGDIQSIIDDVFIALDKEYQAFKGLEEGIRKFFGDSCADKILNMINTTKKSIIGLQKNIKEYEKRFSNNFINKVRDPILCRNYNTQDVLPFIYNTENTLNEFRNTHDTNAQVFKNIDANAIMNLCLQTEGDSMNQEKMQNTLEEMMKNMEQKLQEENNGGEEGSEQKGESGEEQQENGEQGKGEDQSKEGEGGDAETNEKDKVGPNQNGEPQYEEILNQKEQELIQKTEEKNENRIQEMQNIKAKGAYKPENYINQLFKKFYGNDGDFKNLDEEYNTGDSSNIREQNR